MKELTQLLLAAFAAVTVENLFFSRGMGFDRILQSARRGREIGTFSLLIGLFSLLSGLIAGPLNRMLPDSLGWGPVSAGGTGVCCLAVCLVTACGVAALVSGAGGSEYGGTVHTHSDRIKRLEPLANGGLCNRHRICFLVRSLAACRNDSPVPSYEYAGCISGNACGVSLSGYSGAGHDGLCPKLTGT